MTAKIMIVTGEASGDLHGANLLQAIQDDYPELEAFGMGGRALAAKGMEILFDAAKVSVVGIIEVFSQLIDIFSAQKILRREMRRRKPDLLILIDLPDFNMLLLSTAKKLEIPIFYYIPPQMWAWRSERVKKLRANVDRIGVIFPFDVDFFSRYGVDAEYVGQPLLDSVETTCSRQVFCAVNGIDATAQCIGLLPGSRKREVSSLLPVFLAAARNMQNRARDRFVFLLPQASTISKKDLDDAGLAIFQRELDIRVIEENRYDLMAACNAAIAASGTVSLELAILQVPMVVCYKLSPLTYHLAKFLVKLDYFSLPNLIAGYRAVPEFLQHEVNEQVIATEIMALLEDSAKMQEVKRALKEVKNKLGDAGASKKAAAVAIAMLRQRKQL